MPFVTAVPVPCWIPPPTSGRTNLGPHAAPRSHPLPEFYPEALSLLGKEIRPRGSSAACSRRTRPSCALASRAAPAAGLEKDPRVEIGLALAARPSIFSSPKQTNLAPQIARVDIAGALPQRRSRWQRGAPDLACSANQP